MTQAWSDDSEIADLFLKFAPYFKMCLPFPLFVTSLSLPVARCPRATPGPVVCFRYTTYVSNHSASTTFLNKLRETNKRAHEAFSTFLVRQALTDTYTHPHITHITHTPA